MLEVIANLIEFDPDVFEDSQILEDFNHKFLNSWVNIDGKFQRVISLYQDDDEQYVLKTSNLEGDSEYLKLNRIRKITKHMPETGLYKSKYGLLYLARLPARQWLKSYAEGKNYRLHALAQGKDGGTPNTRNTVLNPDSEYNRETMIDDYNQVWLHWRNVGTLDKRSHTIYLATNTFIKEITELWPQYQITSGAKPRLDQQDAKLITDF